MKKVIGIVFVLVSFNQLAGMEAVKDWQQQQIDRHVCRIAIENFDEDRMERC